MILSVPRGSLAARRGGGGDLLFPISRADRVISFSVTCFLSSNRILSVIKLPNSARLIGSSTRQPWGSAMADVAMDSEEYTEKLDELDHLLNDPDVAVEPTRIWSLLAELTHHDLTAQAGR